MEQTRMSTGQYVAIVDWLRANRERIKQTGVTQLETTAMLTSALGYKVPLSSVQKCAKIAKVTWALSKAKPPPVPTDREAFLILISALGGLYLETGKTIPDGLANLQSRYVRKEAT